MRLKVKLRVVERPRPLDLTLDRRRELVPGRSRPLRQRPAAARHQVALFGREHRQVSDFDERVILLRQVQTETLLDAPLDPSVYLFDTARRLEPDENL